SPSAGRAARGPYHRGPCTRPENGVKLGRKHSVDRLSPRLAGRALSGWAAGKERRKSHVSHANVACSWAGHQIFLYETHECLEESLARIRVLGHEDRGNRGVRAVDRHRDCPVVGIEITHKDAAGHDLVIEDHLRASMRASLL